VSAKETTSTKDDNVRKNNFLVTQRATGKKIEKNEKKK